MTARGALAALVMAVGIVLAGCGDDAPPGSLVPSLTEDLQRVDDAIVDRDFDEAATALDDIEVATRAARDDGTLDDSEAAGILAAVEALREALATRRESQPTTPESSPTETQPPPPTSDDDEGDEGEDGEGEDGEDGEGKKNKGKGKGNGKGDDD